MAFTLSIQNQGVIKARAQGETAVQLCYQGEYTQGDTIVLTPSEPCFAVLSLEKSLDETYVYLVGEYQFPIPFGADRISYSPICFTFNSHVLSARLASAQEIALHKTLCRNCYDHHKNTGAYPHAFANVETRNEAIFAARNAIDGVSTSGGHGPYPYQSWGINQQADAQITVDFGRAVDIDAIAITLRSDFPHDNWWHRVCLQFSDGSRETIALQKTGDAQYFPMIKNGINSITMCEMLKDETDPSPFPALMQLEAFGTEHQA
ncbi:MAG: carbohydrate-binding protein [Faecalibacterium sp.]